MVRAYVWECVGALVAGIIYTYWLLEKMNPALIISCFTLPLLIGSAFVAAGATKKKALAVHVLLLVFNLYAILAGGAGTIRLLAGQTEMAGAVVRDLGGKPGFEIPEPAVGSEPAASIACTATASWQRYSRTTTRSGYWPPRSSPSIRGRGASWSSAKGPAAWPGISCATR